MLRALARYCPSTALALSMHTHLVTPRRCGGISMDSRRRLLTRSPRSVSSCWSGGGDWLDSVGSAQRVEGGYRVSGQKRFASGAPPATW